LLESGVFAMLTILQDIK